MRTFLRRLGTAFLFLIVGLCFVPSVVPPFLDRIYYTGPKSSHFDGAHFFDPEEPGRRPAAIPARVMRRWMTGEGRARWPATVPIAPTAPPQRIEGQRMLATWVGHSTVLVQTAGLNILTDPIWSDRASPVSFFGPRRVRAPGIRFEDLPRIDLVLVSHNHYDHMDLPTLKRLWDRDRPLIVTSLGNDTILNGAGIGVHAGTGPPPATGVYALDWGQAISASGRCEAGHSCPGPVTVTVLRNHHWGSRWGTDRNRALWSAFKVATPAGNIFFAGDTGLGNGSWPAEAAAHGPYRLAILPIGAYLPRDIMASSHMNPDESVAAFRRLGARTALGVHWGTFQLTFEPIGDPPRRLAAALKAKGVAPDRFLATEVGKTFDVP